MAEGRRGARSAGGSAGSRSTRGASSSRKRSAGRPIGASRRRAEAVEVAEAAPETVATGRVVDASTRFAGLREAVAGFRTRAASGDVERYLLIAGAVFMPLGLVLILLGWRGASNTPYPFEQTPYVISGGLLGLGLMVAGGFLYFGYWLTRMVREQRAAADRLADALERIEEAFGGGMGRNGSVRSVGARSARATGAGGSAFVATPGGSMFHRPDCVVVEGKPGLKPATGKEKDLQPCGICDPLAA